ncbi:GntR family transcriptional regulator [Actinomadura sp. 3N407]|uniref:GntR family transcriptional regulator n=1 Tax=Actinomadura sp. 3N407 TaxID=3457423 RepID=UPI003FCE3A99
MTSTDRLGQVDPTLDRAVFRQIGDQLRAAIETGVFGEGERLPSETQLVAHYGVARMTVRQALALLQADGLAVAEHGKGVFVRQRPPVRRLASDRFARQHRKSGKAAFIVETEGAGGHPTVDQIEISDRVASPPIAAKLGLAADAHVVIRSRRYLIDGHPVETATSYIPADLARGTRIQEPNPGPGGIYARLEEQGHTLDHFDEEITGRMPLPHEVSALQLGAGIPVFNLVRTAFDVEGRAVEICDTVMATDRYILHYRLPAR